MTYNHRLMNGTTLRARPTRLYDIDQCHARFKPGKKGRTTINKGFIYDGGIHDA